MGEHSNFQERLQKDLQQANKIEDLHERWLFLKEKKKEYGKYVARGFNIDFGNVLQQYQLEIDHIQDQINTGNQHKNTRSKEIQPIWWKRSARLLKYLMEELAKQDYIDRESPLNKHIKEHFIDKNKNPFSDSIKQNSSGTGLTKIGKPKGHGEIDKLIDSLKKQQE